MADPTIPASEVEDTRQQRHRNWWPFAALGCLSLPFLLVGACTAVVFGLNATVWDGGGEPDVIRAVEPEGVTRVLEVQEDTYGTDDTPPDYFLIFYKSERPFHEIERDYVEAMEARGYAVDAADFVDGSGRNIEFIKKGEVGSCVDLGTYPHGVFMWDRHRPPELERLESDEYAYVISYWVENGWFHSWTDC